LRLVGIACVAAVCSAQPVASDSHEAARIPAMQVEGANAEAKQNWPGSSAAGPFVMDSSKPASELLEESMAIMSREMMRAPMSGDPDRDFVSMMIPHHQGAIDMAKVEVLYGKDPALRRLAQEIIVTQGSEIALMERGLRTMRSYEQHDPSKKDATR